MPKIEYISKRFNAERLHMIELSNEIIEEYALEDLRLTLRQLYYKFVGRGWFPDTRRWRLATGNKWVRDPEGTRNANPNYKWLGDIIADGRMAGLIDWNAIEDRTRSLKQNYHNTDPGDAVADALRCFRLNRWLEQPYRPEVWVEKEALINVVAQICTPLDVPFFAAKGYPSKSAMWQASMRLQRYREGGQEPIIIHLGDHDPSGIDMTRDINDQHATFMGGLRVRRIALTMDQVEEYNCPSDPAKLSDTRADKYIDQYGELSWELDALEPRVIRDLIERTVAEYTDQDLMNDTLNQEVQYRDVLQNVVDNWETL